MLYSASFSRLAGGAGQFVFAGGSGLNGGKVFHTQELMAFASDIGSARGEMVDGESRGDDSSSGLRARTCRPLAASITGLPAGVFGSDWDGGTGLVVVGGAQPIRVFDIGVARWSNIESGGGLIAAGVSKRHRALRAAAEAAHAAETAEALSSASSVANSGDTILLDPGPASGDAATFVTEGVLPPPAPPVLPVQPVQPVQPVLSTPPALPDDAGAPAALSETEGGAISSNSDTLIQSYPPPLTDAARASARAAAALAALAQESELARAMAATEIADWGSGEEVVVRDAREASATSATDNDEDAAEFDAGFGKGAVKDAERPTSAAARVRRGSGAVDALRAAVEGARATTDAE